MYVFRRQPLHSIQTLMLLHGGINIHMQIYKSASAFARRPAEVSGFPKNLNKLRDCEEPTRTLGVANKFIPKNIIREPKVPPESLSFHWVTENKDKDSADPD